MKSYLGDEAATTALAERLSGALPERIGGLTLLLQGDLGAGKSTFARSLIHAMGHTGPVPSPTYTLVEPYDLPPGQVYHIDLYRVSSEDELRYLGWNELDEGFRIVEWPERAPAITAQADLLVRLAYEGAGRSAEIEARSERGRRIVAAMKMQPITDPVV